MAYNEINRGGQEPPVVTDTPSHLHPAPPSGNPALPEGTWQYALWDQMTGEILELPKETVYGAARMATQHGNFLVPMRRWVGGWFTAPLSTEENNG